MEFWFRIDREETLPSPALLFYRERISSNILKMIEIAGTPDRLRPHVKTYKCAELVKMQMDAGIQKFKCATLAEAKMLIEAGAPDILVAYPLVGPSQEAFLALTTGTESQLSVLVDHPDQIRQWKRLTDDPVHCFVDLNVGMDRTGIRPEVAISLLPLFSENIVFRGWHIYDGHIHDREMEQREQHITRSFQSVLELLERAGPAFHGELLCGGSISFPVHAKFAERTLSPGTTVLWDHGYGSQYPDLDFEIAACLITRVVSKPSGKSICLDLGYKAIAAEMQAAPAYFPQVPDARIVNHSEEHLVIETDRSAEFEIGSILYVFPWHICPTVALYNQAWLVENREITVPIGITARARYY